MSGARQAKEEISIATVGKIRGEPKIQFESGEAMEKCEKSVCLPATAPEQRLETQHWADPSLAWPALCAAWSLVPGDPGTTCHNNWFTLITYTISGVTERKQYASVGCWTEKLGLVSRIPIE